MQFRLIRYPVIKRLGQSDDPFRGHAGALRQHKSYDELLAALLADIGEQPVPINDIATTTDSWESYQAQVEIRIGPSGFMLFGVVGHGAWITKAGIDRKAIRVMLGSSTPCTSGVRGMVCRRCARAAGWPTRPSSGGSASSGRHQGRVAVCT
jgi:hypothetical protein